MQIYNSFTPEVVALLKAGKIGVIPSDTTYGVVASLFNEEAVERIYVVKKRALDKRVGTTLITDTTDLKAYVSPEELNAAKDFWPGPVSIELFVGDNFVYAHRGHQTLAFRVPDNQQVMSLLKQTGPLATSSANIAEEKPADNLGEAIEYFGETVDFYVDGGDLSHRQPSRIIKIINGNVEEIRS